MSLQYSCVKVEDGSTIDCALRGGSYSAQAQRVLAKIDPGYPRKASYQSDQFLFHVLVAGGVIFLCIADREYKQGLAFQFLDKIRVAYTSNRGTNARQMLQGKMKTEMEFFNTDKADKVKQVKNQIEEVKGVMIENVDRLLERGEKIDDLVDRTEVLVQQSEGFLDGSRELRRAMWWKNVKIILLIVFVVLILIFVIVLIACGGFTFAKCKSDSPPPPPPGPPGPPAPPPATPQPTAVLRL